MPRRKKVQKELNDPSTDSAGSPQAGSGSSEDELKRELKGIREKKRDVLRVQQEEKQKRIQEFKDKKKKGRTPRAILGCLLVVIIFIIILVGWTFTLKYKFSKDTGESSSFGNLFEGFKGNIDEMVSDFNEQVSELEEIAENVNLTPEEVEELKEKITETQPEIYPAEEAPPAPIKPEEVGLLDASSWPVYYNDDYGYRLKYPEEWNKDMLEASGEVLSKTYFSLGEKEVKVSVYERTWWDENLGQDEFNQETIGDEEVLVSTDGSHYYLFNEEKLYLINFSGEINKDLKYTILNNFVFL